MKKGQQAHGGWKAEPMTLEDIIELYNGELEQIFIEKNLSTEIGLNKDNCEDLFSGWLDNQDREGLIELLEEKYGKSI